LTTAGSSTSPAGVVTDELPTLTTTFIGPSNVVSSGAVDRGLTAAG
jgi:hypothetical protein